MRTLNDKILAVIIRKTPTQANIEQNISTILARVRPSPGETFTTFSSDGVQTVFDHNGTPTDKMRMESPAFDMDTHMKRVDKTMSAEIVARVLGIPELTVQGIAASSEQIVQLLGITRHEILNIVMPDGSIVYLDHNGFPEHPPKERPNYPSFYQQMKNAAKAGAKLVAQAATGGPVFVPPEVKAARVAACQACPKWDSTGAAGTGRCTVCGCSTAAKLALATEQCPHPDGPRWTRWEPA